MLFGLLYGALAGALGAYLLSLADPLLQPDTLVFKVVHGAVVLGVAIPSIALIFRGVVYVPKRE